MAVRVFVVALFLLASFVPWSHAHPQCLDSLPPFERENKVCKELRSPGEDTNPGIQSAFTTKGLSYIAEIGRPILDKQLHRLKIPDISDGGCKVKRFTIDSFTLPSLSLTTSAAHGLTISSTGLDVALSFKWQCKKFKISVSGAADMKGHGISLSASAVVRRDPQGHPTLKSTSCAFNIGSLSVKFSKSIASWIANLFQGKIEKKIKSALERKACDGIMAAINRQASMMITSLPVTAPVDKTAVINYALVDDPIFTDTYILSRNKGEFMNRVHPVEAPFSAPPLPGVSEMDRMIYFWLSEYMANTAGYVYQKAGAFKHTLTPENTKIPPFVSHRMNTKSLEYIIPELYQKFPDMDLVLEVDAENPPVVKITPGGVGAAIPGQIAVYARANGIRHFAFTLGLMVHTNVTVSISDREGRTYITVEAQCIKTEMTLEKTDIGEINLAILQNLMHVLGDVGVNYLNQFGKVGFPIPTLEGITMVSSSVRLGQGYVLVATDFHYRPEHLVKMYSFATEV